jgi:hypothetical protein
MRNWKSILNNLKKKIYIYIYCPIHKKRKIISKQKVKERIEDEIIERGERINDDSNSTVPAICYKCEIIREKYSVQENNETLND